MSTQVIKGVTLNAPITTASEQARKNIDTIIEFFSLYLKDKQRFYALWVDDEPQVITGEDPDVIVTKSNSVIDVHAGPFWGDKAVKYNGRYVQIFKFVDGKVKSFEEYYDTALLNSAYGA